MLWRFLGQIASISKKIFTVAFRLLFEICLLLFWWSCGVQCFWLGKGSVKASCNFSLHLFRGALWSIKLCGEFPRLLCLIILRPQFLFTFFLIPSTPPYIFLRSPRKWFRFLRRGSSNLCLHLFSRFLQFWPHLCPISFHHFISLQCVAWKFILFHFIVIWLHFISYHRMSDAWAWHAKAELALYETNESSWAESSPSAKKMSGPSGHRC